MAITSVDREGGFTLLEVLIALFIFTIGILGLNAMQLSSIVGNSKANVITETTNIASSRIESLLFLDYSDPLLSDVDNDGTNQDANNDGVDDNGGNFGLDDATAATADHQLVDGNYTIFWNVANDLPVPNAKTIKVIAIPANRGSRVTMEFIKTSI